MCYNINVIRTGLQKSKNYENEVIKMARTENEIINDIIKYFGEHNDVFYDCVEELDSWNGYRGDDRYYLMDDINDFFIGCQADEILDRVFSGEDECGSKGFNPNRYYFRFNIYGGLVSADYPNYLSYNDKCTVISMLKNRDYLYIDFDEKLTALFDELEDIAA
jgi:hypothetical protein